MSVTIRKIAKDLKLAVSTVSKAISDSYEISEETKRKVLEYVQKHNYVPNPYAGSLKNRKTKNIAVVVPEVADTFFSNAINGIDSVAQANGYHVIIYITHESAEREGEILRELHSGRVDGVLVSVSVGVTGDSDIHNRLAKELPLIFFDRACDKIDVAKVLTDDFESSYRATNHLISRGCQNVVFLGATGGLAIIDQRLQGFVKAFAERGAAVLDHQVIMCGGHAVESMDIIRNALSGENKIDGIVASVEKLAMHSYTVCHEMGLVIPDDIKVVAFSNLQIASLLAPPLTVVVQPSFEMGKAAATLLFKALIKKVNIQKEQIVLPSVFIERESTSRR